MSRRRGGKEEEEEGHYAEKERHYAEEERHIVLDLRRGHPDFEEERMNLDKIGDLVDEMAEEDEEREDSLDAILDLCSMLHEKLVLHWSAQIEEERRRYGVIKTRAERAIEASAHRGGIMGRAGGDVTLDRIQNLFHNGLGVKWSGVQVEIFNVFVDTCLPKIYGEHWPEHMARVLRKRGLSRTRQEALINMGRRNGKTYVTSGTAAALLLSVPDISIAIFSTGERTARMLMDVVRKMIKSAFREGTVVKESDFSVVQSNKEILLLEGPDGTKRLLGCYPGSVRTTRGTGADVIIIDEAAHIDPQLFYQTILPILQMKNTALMCLSSPEGNDNYYSQLLQLEDPLTGDSFFRVYECIMICKDCQKLEREEAIRCDHVQQQAHWLSQKKGQRLKLLYKSNPALAMREFGGMVVSDFLPAFRKEEINFLFDDRKKHRTQHAPRYIFTAADPNGGGPSHMAICSGYFLNGTLIIIGLDSEGVKHSAEEFDLLRRHFKRINEHPHWRSAQKVFIPENNLGLEASHLHTMVKQFHDVHTFWETPKKPGICKTHQKTIDYTFLFNSMLSDRGIALDEDLFTISKGMTQESIVALFREQVERFHWEKKGATDSFGKDRWAITGKMGADKQDDLLITAFMVAFFGKGIILDPSRLQI